MLLRALRPFAEHPRVAVIVVALPPGQTGPPWLRDLASDRLRLVPGGENRTSSVRAGLGALPPSCRIVLVHDAARPFVSRQTIDAVIGAAESDGGAVAAVPVNDTLKRSRPDQTIGETVSRNGLWRAQTPQGFLRSVLDVAYQRWNEHGADREVTDDASIVEAAGGTVRLVPDESTNLKVTTPEDFLLAEALARR
jgi:2-C-methyl-D-erythritol 4-phosphate cytidylyltransferase